MPNDLRHLIFFVLFITLAWSGCVSQTLNPLPKSVPTISVESQELLLPLKSNSVRFAVIGDNGTGHKKQYEVAQQMMQYHQRFPFEFVLMLGDNIYGPDTPVGFQRKFERPYKGLLDEGVKFYAVLGNHDDPDQCFYEGFNMNGKKYYAYTMGNCRFFALDSNHMNPQQLDWLEKELRNAGSTWKICYFHHPLYSSGRHGSATDLRALLEPLFLKYQVNVVFSGHEHLYERIKPQKGVYYFTSGAAGHLRRGDIRKTGLTAAGYDQDLSFMLIEIAGDELYFLSISRTGETVDSGVIQRTPQSHALELSGQRGHYQWATEAFFVRPHPPPRLSWSGWEGAPSPSGVS